MQILNDMYANPQPKVGGGVGLISQKIFCKELNEMSRSVQKSHVSNPPPLEGMGGDHVPK